MCILAPIVSGMGIGSIRGLGRFDLNLEQFFLTRDVAYRIDDKGCRVDRTASCGASHRSRVFGVSQSRSDRNQLLVRIQRFGTCL